MAVCDDGQHVTDGPMKGIAYVLRTVVFVGEKLEGSTLTPAQCRGGSV